MGLGISASNQINNSLNRTENNLTERRENLGACTRAE